VRRWTRFWIDIVELMQMKIQFGTQVKLSLRLIRTFPRDNSKICSSTLNSWTRKSQKHSTNLLKLVEGKRISEGQPPKRYQLRQVKALTKKRVKMTHRCISNLREKKDNKIQILLLITTLRERVQVLQRIKSVRISVPMQPKNYMKLHILDWNIPLSIFLERIKDKFLGKV